MKKVLEYYYGIIIDDIKKDKDNYYFSYNNSSYEFIKSNNINNRIYKDNNMDSIIYNINKEIFTNTEEGSFVLINKKNNNLNKISFTDIIDYLNIFKIEYGITNWKEMWERNTDVLENYLNANDSIDSDIKIVINYFIGLSENAIKYYNLVNQGSNNIIIPVHNRIYSTYKVKDLYNPLNIIKDDYTRMISEYIKYCFNNGIDYDEVIRSNFITNNDFIKIISRLLYPSYFYDYIYEYFNKNMDKQSILELYKKTDNYEKKINDLINKIKKTRNINIPSIKWIDN